MGTVLLTRVECLCGRSAAIPEGGYFPLCGRCGRRMVAPATTDRVNYVSEPLETTEAVRRHVASEDGYAGHVRVYPDETLIAVLTERDWPIEPQPWPKVDSPDGVRYATPPWEVLAR
jgi:hypothetical protein